MKFLFIHQNYPGQFKHLAVALAAIPGNEVVAMVDVANKRPASLQPGVRLISYASPKGATKETHWYLRSYEAAIRRGQQVAKAAIELKRQGFVPDVICVHAGWGEALFLKDVYPQAAIVDYFEFYYRTQGADVGFDPEFQSYNIDEFCRIKVRNSNHLLSLDNCDWGLTPTEWQASQFPDVYRSKISVIHEGVDTNIVRPDNNAQFMVSDTLTLTAAQQVITFVNRNLEPYRGFHIFMRALPRILRDCPQAHVVLVGGDEISYGRMPEEGGNWREKMMKEVGAELDMTRVHFVGKVAYERYLSLLQISAAHVYLTYPFVLSWSMLEAMAAGCVLIASNTAPVAEVIRDGHDGLLVDFFDVQALAERVAEVVNKPENYASLRENARQTILQQYDLQSVCLPRQLDLLQKLPSMLAG